MPRYLVVPLQLACGLALVISVWAQLILVPTMAAHEVEQFPPYAPLQVPLVSGGITFLACCQVALIALVFLLRKIAAGSLFSQPALTWVNVLIGTLAAATLLTFGLFAYVSFADIPSPSDGMEVIGLWLGSATAAAATLILLLFSLIGRRLLLKAIGMHSELDELI